MRTKAKLFVTIVNVYHNYNVITLTKCGHIPNIIILYVCDDTFRMFVAFANLTKAQMRNILISTAESLLLCELISFNIREMFKFP